MSYQTTVEVKCDQCGKSEKVSSSEMLPRGWVSFRNNPNFAQSMQVGAIRITPSGQRDFCTEGCCKRWLIDRMKDDDLNEAIGLLRRDSENKRFPFAPKQKRGKDGTNNAG